MPLNPPTSQTGATPVPKGAGRSALLDFLRFAAAGLIVLYHFQDEGPAPLATYSPIFLRGYLATDFFLILSGYVLGRAYGRQVAAGLVSDESFLLKRVLRIWPAHLVMLAAFAAVIAVAGMAGVSPHNPSQFLWSELPSQAVLMHAWGLERGWGWNLPTWSLSALVVCYAAFPTLWRKLTRLNSAVLTVVIGLGGVWGADLVCRRLLGRPLYDLPFDLGVIRALPLFIFGVCIARAGELISPPQIWTSVTAVLAAAAAITVQEFGRHDLVSMMLLGLLIASAGATRTERGGALAARAGRISFALYITHIFVSLVWFNAVRQLEARIDLPGWAQWGLWGLALPAALFTALLFERLVDQPLQDWVAARMAAFGRPQRVSAGA